MLGGHRSAHLSTGREGIGHGADGGGEEGVGEEVGFSGCERGSGEEGREIIEKKCPRVLASLSVSQRIQLLFLTLRELNQTPWPGDFITPYVPIFMRLLCLPMHKLGVRLECCSEWLWLVTSANQRLDCIFVNKGPFPDAAQILEHPDLKLLNLLETKKKKKKGTYRYSI